MVIPIARAVVSARLSFGGHDSEGGEVLSDHSSCRGNRCGTRRKLPSSSNEPQAGEVVWLTPSFVHRRDPADQGSGVARKLHDRAKGFNWEEERGRFPVWVHHVVEDLLIPISQPPLRVRHRAARVSEARFKFLDPALQVPHRRIVVSRDAPASGACSSHSAAARLLQRSCSLGRVAEILRAGRGGRAHAGDGNAPPGTLRARTRPRPQGCSNDCGSRRIRDHCSKAHRGVGPVQEPGPKLQELRN